MRKPLIMDGLNPRQQDIFDLVQSQDFVSVKELGEKLNVSLVTIRKDLTLMENMKLLYRTHGGASKRERYVFEKPVMEKTKIRVEAKTKIAQAAATLVKEDDFLVLASGTSIHYLATELKKFNHLTVATPSLYVSHELAFNPLIDIIQIGGELRKSSRSVIGSMAEKSVEQFSSHLLFLGVDGIDLDFGISTSNSAEAQLNRVMIQQSNKVVVLADASKINKKGFGKITDISDIDILITDQEIEEKFRKGLEEHGIEVMIVNDM